LKSISVLIRVCIYIAMTSIMAVVNLKVNNILFVILCVLLYSFFIVVLISWRTFSCIWVCDECGERFKMTLWASFKSYFTSLTNQLYHRRLYCHKCNENTWCRGTFQE
jgi:hypothetical protein